MASTSQMAAKVVGVIIVAVIGSVVLASVLPVGIDMLTGVDTSSWPSNVALIFDSLVYFVILMPLAALAAIVVDLF